MGDRLLADNFDIGVILEELRSLGATSVRCMDEERRAELAQVAARCSYRSGETVVGSGDRMVRQELAVADRIPEAGAFSALRDEFQGLMEGLLSQLEDYPFESPLWFNEMVLQRYERGSIGITPHRDHVAYVNLVCIFNLAGRGRFGVASDRSGRDARCIDAVPGDVILMRAPGFAGARTRPFHFVRDIEETRYVLGLRQIRSREETTERASCPQQPALADVNPR